MSPDLPTVALTLPFTNSWMLLWGIAAAIPILIHLWSRKHYQEVTWAAMEYLLAAIRTSSRRLTIEQLILLAVRVAILLLLALALANPVLKNLSPVGIGPASGGRTHWVVVVDSSYSMGYRASDKSNFELAKDRAIRLIETGTQGDGFTLIMLASPPRVIVRDPAFARGDIIQELEELKLLHQGADLTATLAEVEKLVFAAKQKHPRLTQTNVCFLTDLGSTTWKDIESTDCRERIGRLAEHAELLLFEIGDQSLDNLAVTKIQSREPIAIASQRVPFVAEIRNFGPQQQPSVSVEVLVDGQIILDRQVDVPGDGRANIAWEHAFAVPGEHYVEVRIQEDPLTVDNHRWLSVPVRESIRTLCIAGKPGAARYVAVALNPEQSERPRIRTRVAAENALVEEDLSQYDSIFLCNIGRFGRDEATVLAEYVKRGGGLIVLLGDLVQADNYNELLGSSVTAPRVLPAKLGLVVETAENRFDPLEYRHPIVAPFRGHEESGLLSTPVWNYFQLQPYEDAAAEVAMSFSAGDPAIITGSVGRGTTVLYASAASGASLDRTKPTPTRWTEIHTWPSFPPLVQEMLAFAMRGQTASRNVNAGTPLEGHLHPDFGKVSLSLVTPAGESEQIRPVQEQANQWFYDATDRSGIYQLEIRHPVNSQQIYAVNVDTRESNLARCAPDLVPSQLQRGDEEHEVPSPQLASANKTDVFQYFLVAILILLACESAMAWKFGWASLANRT